MLNSILKRSSSQIKVETSFNLNLWVCIFRFLMFCLLAAIVVFDIIFLIKTDNDDYREHFNMVLAFFIIPFGINMVNNLFSCCMLLPMETENFNCFFKFIYRLFNFFGLEFFCIYLFTAFTGKSNPFLEMKLTLSNNINLLIIKNY